MLTTERLLDERWEGKLYSGGWIEGGGDALVVRDKATGESLAELVAGTADDVSRAAGIAAEAQRAWRDTYAVEQRAVFIKAAQLMDEHRAEIADWIVRETGGVRPKAEFELKMSLDELLEAAAMPTQPTGMVVPGNQPGLTSIARRNPARRGRRHLAVELPAHPRPALGRPRARVGERGDPQAGSPDAGGRRRRAWRPRPARGDRSCIRGRSA